MAQREGLVVGAPAIALEVQPQGLLLAAEEYRGLAVGPDDPKVRDFGEPLCTPKGRGFPGAGAWLPAPD